MNFSVADTDRTLRSQIEEGPTHPCHAGDEMCAFRPGGPCTAVPCTCETTGVCYSCVPQLDVYYPGPITRIP